MSSAPSACCWPGGSPGGDSSAAGFIFELVSRFDGAKILLLAVVAVSAIALARPSGTLPAWAVYPNG